MALSYRTWLINSNNGNKSPGIDGSDQSRWPRKNRKENRVVPTGSRPSLWRFHQGWVRSGFHESQRRSCPNGNKYFYKVNKKSSQLFKERTKRFYNIRVYYFPSQDQIISTGCFSYFKDPGSAEAFKDDPVSQTFLKSGAEKLKTTMKPSEVDVRYSLFLIFLLCTSWTCVFPQIILFCPKWLGCV